MIALAFTFNQNANEICVGVLSTGLMTTGTLVVLVDMIIENSVAEIFKLIEYTDTGFISSHQLTFVTYSTFFQRPSLANRNYNFQAVLTES